MLFLTLKRRSSYQNIFNFRAFAYIDRSIIIIMVLISIVSIVNMYSIDIGRDTQCYGRHVMYLCAGFIVAIMMSCIKISWIEAMVPVIYIMSLLLLIAVKFFGHYSYGAVRWLNFGFITIQPSELVKLSLILYCARYYQMIHSHEVGTFAVTFYLLLLFAPLLLLVYFQPDLATASILVAIFICILWVMGIHLYYFIATAIATIVSMPLLWRCMHQYQKLRIINFFYPTNDPLGSGYNIIQSKIAIGSGGLYGNGFGNGSQSKLHFLPSAHTDFAVAIIGEEWGFLGMIFLLFLYGYIVYFCFMTTLDAKNAFINVLAVGIGSYFSIHMFCNIGMAIGILPVMGIPMPFISYGGTSTLVSFAMIGLLLSANLYNKK